MMKRSSHTIIIHNTGTFYRERLYSYGRLIELLPYLNGVLTVVLTVANKSHYITLQMFVDFDTIWNYEYSFLFINIIISIYSINKIKSLILPPII